MFGIKTYRKWFGLVAAVFFWVLMSGCQQSIVPSGATVLFQDSFVPGEMGDWQIEGDASGRTAVVDEQLTIEINAPQTLQYTTLNEPSFTDFTLEVDVRQLRGDPQSSYGVLFRMVSPNQFYRFDITGNGLYMLERRNADGTWTRFVDDWTSSEALNQGINSTNRLKVEARERNINIYANGILLQQFSDNLYPNGTIALDAGTFIAPDLKVAFDNVLVTE